MARPNPHNADARCPGCGAWSVVLANTSWAECVNPFCNYPYAIMDTWARVPSTEELGLWPLPAPAKVAS